LGKRETKEGLTVQTKKKEGQSEGGLTLHMPSSEKRKLPWGTLGGESGRGKRAKKPHRKQQVEEPRGELRKTSESLTK